MAEDSQTETVGQENQHGIKVFGGATATAEPNPNPNPDSAKPEKQGDLCEIIDKTQSYLSKLENDMHTPSIKTMNKIADAFKIPFQVLVWHSLKEEQIPEEKREFFKVWKPSIDDFIENTFK